MADPIIPDLTDRLVEAAGSPVKAVSDGMEADEQPLTSLIAVDKYLKSQAALAGTGGRRSGWGALRIARTRANGPGPC